MKQLIEDIAKALVDIPEEKLLFRVVEESRSPFWNCESRPTTWAR